MQEIKLNLLLLVHFYFSFTKHPFSSFHVAFLIRVMLLRFIPPDMVIGAVGLILSHQKRDEDASLL
jgi:hypothetical protein